jgi:hypothetical protein
MLLPPDPALEPLHHRDYEVKAFRKGPGEVLLRGAVRDRKPGTLYDKDDPEPLTVHHMLVDLTVTFPRLEITGVDVIFETHPQPGCPRIVDHYDRLIGLSIARGFIQQVRELFGGPRGCTHVTALLQAMAPVAIQCSFTPPGGGQESGGQQPSGEQPVSFQSRRAGVRPIVNTCHVWAEDGEIVAGFDRGEMPPLPLPVTRRLLDRGIDPRTWRPGGG